MCYNTFVHKEYEKCTLCPRSCGTDRRNGRGYCGAPAETVVAKVMLHVWEEPCISGERGSGAVFFSGCNLRCSFCQNRDISFATKGERVSDQALAEIFMRLQSDGAHNINLVTATPYLPAVTNALRIARDRGLEIPAVYNTGGYETPEAIDALAKVVDVWLPDFKYADPSLSFKYSRASDYPEVALRAIDRMVELSGAPVIENGLIKRGVILRYLVLPGQRRDGETVLRTVAERWGGKVLLSLMRQFTPEFASPDCDLKRRVTAFEYNSLLNLAISLGLDGYFQDASSAVSSFTPAF